MHIEIKDAKNGGYDIRVVGLSEEISARGTTTKAWAYMRHDALHKARQFQDYYHDENGQSIDIKELTWAAKK